ncbi:histidine kinase [Mycobacterium sp. BK086]|uniref:sensor histidine kinase n=1 Tax=Mycobacterium sp. BK086 TaxID=2512165 RepID=UPI002570E525|nr:histidine kinase [Mycobacterium sp. BK086]
MLVAVRRQFREWARSREPMIPAGFSWTFVVIIDVTMVAIGLVATLQRPMSDWPVALAAIVVAFMPWVLFFVFNVCKYEGPALWAAWMAGTAVLLFATSTPVRGDFAPLLLTLTVGVVGAITSKLGGFLAAASAAALLIGAAAAHRLETPELYLAFLGIGWLVGYLIHVQRQLLIEQQRTQAELAAHAAADERRRIAREIHDVIAHSLSITLLHLTGARHALEHGGADAAAVDALRQAEELGRQAMSDVRRTVGLLDAGNESLAPEPGVEDIAGLTDDFIRAGLNLTAEIRGSYQNVSPAAGLALYRIAQESLTNIAKHAPASSSSLALVISAHEATLSVVNDADGAGVVPRTARGRGLNGMEQRIEIFGGTVHAGPRGDGWSVRAQLPLDTAR